MSFLASTALVASSGLSSLIDPVAKPIAAVLAAIYSVVPNYGVAILVLSVVWMVLISPLTLKTTRSMLAMQKLQPQLKKLQEQHKNDRQAFAQAQMELFREHNASPFGACLPTLLPLPIFFALFRVINGLSHFHNGFPQYLGVHTRMSQDIVAAHGHLNAFGLDLSKNALSSHSSIWAALPFFILLLVMMGTQYLQSAQMMSRNPQAQNNPQAKMMKFLPLVFGVFCVQFPAGVVLYYAMSNVCRIGQQSAMYRYDPKVRALAAKEADEVEAITREIDEADSRKGRGKPGTGSSPKRGGRTTGSPPAPEPTQPSRGRFRDLLAQVSEQQSAAKAQAAERATERQVAKERRPAGGSGNGARPGGARTPQSSTRKPSSTSAGGAARAKPGASGKPGAPGKSGAPGKPPTSGKTGASGKPGTRNEGNAGPANAKAATGKAPGGRSGADGTNDQGGDRGSHQTDGSNGGTPGASGNGDGSTARTGRTGAGAGSGSNRKRRGR